MVRLVRLLPLLAASAPPCGAFSTLPRPPVAATATRRGRALEAARGDGADVLRRAGNAAGSAFLGLAVVASAIASPNVADAVPLDGPNALSSVPSLTIAARTKSTSSEDDVALKELERETRAAEREAEADERKARAELSRKAFFDYEAKMAAQTEERIEAAERKALLEEEKDKEVVEELKALEARAEREAELATTKEERAAKRKEAKALLAKEREAEKKERRAERLERIFLAEEEQEKKILAQKVAAEEAEEKKYEALEEVYEEAAELAKEDEIELSLLKGFLKKK